MMHMGVTWHSNRFSDIARWFREELSLQYGTQETETLLFILFEKFAGQQRHYLIAHPDYRVNESVLLKIHRAVKELKNSKPVQYITGKADFYGLELEVNEHVLIPRPETEELADMVVKDILSSEIKSPVVGDLGSGSGAICLAIKIKIPQAEVHGFEYSTPALKLSVINAGLYKAAIKFHFFDMLGKEKLPVNKKFDVLVSNPPYVLESEKAAMQPNVLNWEPHEALFVTDENPLVYYKTIANSGLVNLAKGGRVYCEINESKGQELKNLFTKMGYRSCKIFKDINNKDRFLKAVI